jgi:hypothetical protein
VCLFRFLRFVCLFLPICFFGFVSSDLFVQVCLFRFVCSFACSDSFVQICLDLFLQICLLRDICFLQIRFLSFVSSDLFLRICFFKFVCSVSFLQNMICFRFVSSDSFLRFFTFASSYLFFSDSFLQSRFFR